MADIPVQRSYQQILGSMIDAFCAEKGIRNLRAGSGIMCSLQAAARSDMRSNQDIFAMLASIDLDKARGLALDRIGQSEDTPRLFQRAATGKVTITDTRYVKVVGKFASSLPTPIAGSTVLYLQDASKFGSSGVLYIGRGTSNYEGPIPFSAVINHGTYWEVTLSNPTAKYHTASEGILLGQGGNRTIGAGQKVSTPVAALSDTISFSLRKAAKLPDGEVEIEGVEVVCTQPGTVGNVPFGSIQAFTNEPFTGASVTNTLPFSNGRETEDDDTYRERIRTVRKTRAKAIISAIKNAVLGLTSDDSSSSITSASIIARASGTTLYIDDGTGYEETSAGVALEVLVDSAAGGEQVFELQHRPVAKASVTSQNTAPYDLSGGQDLYVKVGGVLYLHTFVDSDFINSRSATAYETAASINGDVTLPFAARTINGGTQVVLVARSNANEDIEVTGGDANLALGFPAGRVYSVRLYKNDKLLTKDGQQARYTSQPFSAWSAPSSPATIELAVDLTSAATYTISNDAFIDAQTGFNGVGVNSLDAWATVLNNIVPGVTVTVEDDQLVITSNLGRNSKARVSITGGNLVTAGFFAVGTSQGATSDYIFARNTSTIELATPLTAGDQLSIGTAASRAFAQSKSLVPSTYAELKLWFSVDGNEQVVAHGVTPVTPFSISAAVDSLHSWGHEQKISCTGAFRNVQPRDWLTLTDPVLPATCQGTFKAGKVSPTGDWVTIERTSFNKARVGHELVALKNGSGLSPVLIIGGALTTGTGFALAHLPVAARYTIGNVTNSCDLYDPATGIVTPTGEMTAPRAFHSATLLASGKVLVAGGYNAQGIPVDATDLYDPATGTWTSGPVMTGARVGHTATLLNNGLVLLSGGYNGVAPVATCDLYDPTSNTIVATGPLATARMGHAVGVLGDGSAFAYGGNGVGFSDLTSAELYSVGLGTWANKAASHAGHDAPVLAYDAAANKVLALGAACVDTGDYWNFEVYDVAGDSWTVPANIVLAGGPTSNNVAQARLVVTGDGKAVCTGITSFTAGKRVAASWTDDDGWVFGATDDFYTEAVLVYGSKTCVLTLNNALTNKVLVMGGYDVTNARPTAVIEQYEAGAWTFPGQVTVTNALLTSRGISVTRTSSVPQLLDITPAARIYTATMLADALNGLVPGSSVKPWHTTSLRFATNSYAGTLAVLGANQAAASLGLTSTPQTSSSSQVANVQSASAKTTTPSFQTVTLLGRALPSLGEESYEAIGGYDLAYNLRLRRAKPLTKSLGVHPFVDTAWNNREGHQEGFLFTPVAAGGAAPQRIETRSSVERMLPGEVAVGVRSFAIGPQDDLTVQMDGDAAQRYTTKLYRRLKPVTSSYSQTVKLLDAETNASLVGTLGEEADLSDYALYMKARAVLLDDQMDRKLLVRFYRFGAEGEGVNLVFENPRASSQKAQYGGRGVVNSKTVEQILLPSGARRTSPFSIGQRYLIALNPNDRAVVYTGLSATGAARTTNVVTLTCDLPANLVSHGFQVGDVVYVSTGDVAFPDGSFTITGVTADTISYSQAGADVGAAAITGYVSCNGSETRMDNKGLVLHDFCYFNEALATMRVVEIGRRHVALSLGYLTAIPVQITGNVIDDDTIQFWVNPKKTAAQVVEDLGSMTPALAAKCPVTFTLLDAGAGLIYQSTADELTPTSYYTLTDGLNWVAVSSVSYGATDHYQVTFKKAIASSLTGVCDWQNEELRLVPVTVEGLVRWFNTPAFSGMWGNVEVELADNRLQFSSNLVGSGSTIQVQGGTANEVVAPMTSSNLIRTSAAGGLTGGAWAKLQNVYARPKSGIVTSTDNILSIDAQGYVHTDFDVFQAVVAPQDVPVTFEKVGNFVAIRSLVSLGLSSLAGQILYVSQPAGTTPAPVSSVNCGTYVIVRNEADGTFWVEAPNAVEELATATITVFDPAWTVLPGDKLYLNSSNVPAANRGVWTVETVGAAATTPPYANARYLKLVVSERTPTPCSVSPVGSGVYFEEGAPAHQYVRVTGIVPAFDDPTFTELTFDLPAASLISAAGTVLTVCDKLQFPTDIAAGHDGYQYSTGLIGEATKAVYGDPEDQASYPGEVAAGIQLDISSGYVRRIKVALVVRASTGATRADLASRVKSAVASVINKAGLGQSISIAEMIKAAQTVPGVVSVAWVSPAYSATSDLIVIQGHEKPMVLDLDNDVQVTFAGE